jgi:hypothetical protein
MDNVRGMMVALELSKDLQQRITNYYTYYWNRHRGIDHSIVFSDLSDPLLSEISLCLHSDHVRKVGLSHMVLAILCQHSNSFAFVSTPILGSFFKGLPSALSS